MALLLQRDSIPDACWRAAVNLKMALWAVVIAIAVYGIVLYARGDFA